MRQREKKNGLSAKAVAELVKKKFGVDVSVQTIQGYVKKGHIGVSPMRKGPAGLFPPHQYNNLCAAFDSFMSIIN